MRAYLDMCAWKRPYDRLSTERVRLEALAVAALIEAALAGRLELVSSAMLLAENDRNPDPVRRWSVAALLGALPAVVPLADATVARARDMQAWGLRPLDALHVASAEAGSCTHFVTTDDRMLQALRRQAGRLGFSVLDPLAMASIVEGAPQ